MASLYIKDAETNRMAETLADRRHLSKTAAVKLALANELAKDDERPSLVEIARHLRRTSTLPAANACVADKAFFDDLYDQ